MGTTSGPFLRETLEGLNTGETMTFFEFAPLSIICLVTAAIWLSTAGYKLLPDKPRNEDSFEETTKKKDYSDVPKWKRVLSICLMVATFLGMIFEKQVGIPLHFIAIIGAIIAVGSRCLTVKEATRANPHQRHHYLCGNGSGGYCNDQLWCADLIADAALKVLGSINSPILIILLIFLIITPMTNFMSNAATIILFTPIALIVAESLGISAKAILVAVQFCRFYCCGYPCGNAANSMAVEPGGYSFMDYVKTGLPLTLICIVESIIYIAAFYPLG